LNELSEIDEPGEFVTDVLQIFIEEAEQLARRLPELANDPEVLASEAHKLKAAAAYVGAMRVAYFCGTLENASKSSHAQPDQRAVADLKESLLVSIDAYRERLTRK
jgi:HPt (histidine-containing phosphotransfer) domain-containing protein